jgi:8-oxo-dGTP pyrophosphatase MutT (NUDIX family)
MENNNKNKIDIFQSDDKMNKELNILLLKSNNDQKIVDKCLNNGFNVYLIEDNTSAINTFTEKYEKTKPCNGTFFPIVIVALGVRQDGSDYWQSLISKIRKLTKQVFIIIFSATVCNDPAIRINCFDKGSNMVSSCYDSLEHVLKQINNQITQSSKKQGKLKCPICEFADLSEDSLWTHLPLYHINESNDQIFNCPICKKKATPNLQVHYRNCHGAGGRGEIHSDFCKAPALYSFALAVVHRKSDDKYLLVQEFANSGYWLPGGRVDNGEDLETATIRECKEEAGIDIKITGVLTVQYKGTKDYVRMRVIFYSEPIYDSQLPKSVPDYESAGACYVNANDISKLPLRGNEPITWINYVIEKKSNGIHPVSIFSNEC